MALPAILALLLSNLVGTAVLATILATLTVLFLTLLQSIILVVSFVLGGLVMVYTLKAMARTGDFRPKYVALSLIVFVIIIAAGITLPAIAKDWGVVPLQSTYYQSFDPQTMAGATEEKIPTLFIEVVKPWGWLACTLIVFFFFAVPLVNFLGEKTRKRRR